MRVQTASPRQFGSDEIANERKYDADTISALACGIGFAFVFQITLALGLTGPINAESHNSAAPGRVLLYPAEYSDMAFPHQLGFEKPRDGIARIEFQSEPFYAIILKSGPRCSLLESRRQEIQKLFKNNKVFMSSYLCDAPKEDRVSYTNVNADFSFIAIHAGSAKSDAEALLEDVKHAGMFPGANIRLMRAVLNIPEFWISAISGIRPA